MCQVNGINLEATYNNETSLTCSVNNQLTLPDVLGQQSVAVSIRWVGQNIDHPIDAVTPISGMLHWKVLILLVLLIHSHLYSTCMHSDSLQLC